MFEPRCPSIFPGSLSLQCPPRLNKAAQWDLVGSHHSVPACLFAATGSGFWRRWRPEGKGRLAFHTINLALSVRVISVREADTSRCQTLGSLSGCVQETQDGGEVMEETLKTPQTDHAFVFDSFNSLEGNCNFFTGCMHMETQHKSTAPQSQNQQLVPLQGEKSHIAEG